MTERMATLAREGKRFEKPRELLDEWVKVADEVFTAHFCSEGFCSAQAQLLNAAHRVRRQRRDLMEDALRASDLPTRSDLEEAHKMIYELRKELRGVERELDALRRGEGGPR
jgi:class III poly(R)-hydroxyalkanoic acid synthase PhaE subunit